MKTKLLMEENVRLVKKGSTTARSTAIRRNTEIEGRGGYDDQLNVPVDDRAPPPPYQATKPGRREE